VLPMLLTLSTGASTLLCHGRDDSLSPVSPAALLCAAADSIGWCLSRLPPPGTDSSQAGKLRELK
jgi:hypothetical protein